jgi:adenine phosphoribosyltransferase
MKKRKYHIYLFRHGGTVFNKKKIFTGDHHSNLTKQGVRMSQRVARKLKDKHIDVAYQTRLPRSKKTLKIILKYHPECKKIITDNRMIERDYGDLEGRHHRVVIKEVGKKQFDIWHRSYDKPPPNGESIKMVEKRVRSFIKDLLKKIKKEKINVAISAHGNSMRPFRRHFEKLTIKKMMSRYDVTPIFEKPDVFSNLINDLIKPFKKVKFNKIVGLDALGFIIGGTMAHKLKKGFVVIRKKGKLPGITGTLVSNPYFTDYSKKKKSFQMNKGSIKKGDRVLIVDEWIETGTQMKAAVKLIEKQGGKVVGISTLHAHKNSKTKILFKKYNCRAIGVKEEC